MKRRPAKRCSVTSRCLPAINRRPSRGGKRTIAISSTRTPIPPSRSFQAFLRGCAEGGDAGEVNKKAAGRSGRDARLAGPSALKAPCERVERDEDNVVEHGAPSTSRPSEQKSRSALARIPAVPGKARRPAIRPSETIAVCSATTPSTGGTSIHRQNHKEARLTGHHSLIHHQLLAVPQPCPTAMPFSASSFFARSFLARCVRPMPRRMFGALVNWMLS